MLGHGDIEQGGGAGRIKDKVDEHISGPSP